MTAIVEAPLVGRSAEQAVLNNALDSGSAGRGGLVLVVGEAGIGKSRLAAAAAAEGEARGWPVLHGRAADIGAPMAYRPLAEALSSAVRRGIEPDAVAIEPFRPTLGRLVSEWRTDAPAPVNESQVAVAEAMLRFLGALTKGGVAVVVFEDLHWADPDTLAVIDYLADNLGAERVVCVATARTEATSPMAEFARRVGSRRAATLIELGPLDRAAVAAMVESCLGASEVAGEVLDLAGRAEGVPLMVEELLAAARAGGVLMEESGSWRVGGRLDALVPTSVAESVQRRVRALPREAQRVVVSAAILGRRFPWELLPSITGMRKDDVVAGLHAAVDAHVIIFDPADGTFRFRHALSRDGVLRSLFPPEREALCRRALDAVEDAHPSLDSKWAELAAGLAAGAGDVPRAATLFTAVAEDALRQGALATAEATLERARHLVAGAADAASSECADVEELLLEVLALAGKWDRAVEVARSLLEGLRDDPRSTRRRAHAHLRLARAAVAATRGTEARRHLELADVEAAAGAGEDVVAHLDVVRAQVAIFDDPDDARRLAQTALQAAAQLDLPDVACAALEVLGQVERPRDLTAAEAAFTKSLGTAERYGLAVWRVRALHELGAIDMLRGRDTSRLEEARELSLHAGALATAAVVDVQIAAALVLSDDPESAIVATRRSADLAARYRLDRTLAAACALEAYAHARARRAEQLRQCVEQARSLAAGAPDIEVKTSSATALLALVEEDRAAARRHLVEGLNAAAAGGDHTAVPAIGLFALLHECDGPASAEVEIPEESVHFLAAAFLRYARAVAAGRCGDPARALRLVRDGDALLENHRWMRDLGHRLLAEAALADGWGDPVPWLRDALARYEECGDDRLASACRSLLRRTGARVARRRDLSGVPPALRPLGITSRELEVLELLAHGSSNREISGRLYLSERTVERHVANLAIKTGVDGRSQLVAFAARSVPTT